MKSHRFVAAHFAVMLFLVIANCLANDSATMASFQKQSATKVVDKTARTLNCRNANEYRLVVVENPNRKIDSDPLIPKDLNIVVGDKVISNIELPRVDSEVKNFSLDSVEKNKAGFEIKVNCGGNLDHYEIQFDFRCKQTDFYLYRVKKVSLSTTNPDSGNFWDRKETKVTKIEPNLPIERFVMTDYL